MKNVFNTKHSARIARHGAHEHRFEPGANLVADDVWLALVERPNIASLVERGTLSERPLPSADQDFRGGQLPDSLTALTEDAALRAVLHCRDEKALAAWRLDDPRPEVRRVIDSAITNLKLAYRTRLFDRF